jgi:hypothetical protein
MAKNDFFIGQVFKRGYPPEAANWCNSNNCTIEKTDDGYKIIEVIQTSEELKARKKAVIDTAKKREEYADIEYLDNTYQANADSQAKLTSAVILCQVSGLENYVWWAADNKQITLTLAELVGLSVAITTRSSTLVAKGRKLKDAVEAATNAEELEKISWED